MKIKEEIMETSSVFPLEFENNDLSNQAMKGVTGSINSLMELVDEIDDFLEMGIEIKEGVIDKPYQNSPKNYITNFV